MDAEMKSIERNETWKLTELPAGAKKIGVKWIYKTKFNEFGGVDKYKATLVARANLSNKEWTTVRFLLQ